MSRQPRPRLSPAEFAARYPAKSGNWQPLVTAVRPGTRPGFLSVTVSLAPAELVTVQVNEAYYNAEGLGALAAVLPSVYRSVGLETDLSRLGDA